MPYPSYGAYEKARKGRRIFREEYQADLDYILKKFHAIEGHRHTGAEEDAPKLGIESLLEEVVRGMITERMHRDFLLSKIAPTALYNGANWEYFSFADSLPFRFFPEDSLEILNEIHFYGGARTTNGKFFYLNRHFPFFFANARYNYDLTSGKIKIASKDFSQFEVSDITQGGLRTYIFHTFDCFQYSNSTILSPIQISSITPIVNWTPIFDGTYNRLQNGRGLYIEGFLKSNGEQRLRLQYIGRIGVTFGDEFEYFEKDPQTTSTTVEWSTIFPIEGFRRISIWYFPLCQNCELRLQYWNGTDWVVVPDTWLWYPNSEKNLKKIFPFSDDGVIWVCSPEYNEYIIDDEWGTYSRVGFTNIIDRTGSSSISYYFRITGYFYIPSSAQYHVRISTDDGHNFYIDDERLIYNYLTGVATTNTLENLYLSEGWHKFFLLVRNEDPGRPWKWTIEISSDGGSTYTILGNEPYKIARFAHNITT
jgi:hypothetical protein